MDQVPEKQSRNRKINKNVFISYKRLLDEILSLKKTTLKANISKCILVHLKNQLVLIKTHNIPVQEYIIEKRKKILMVYHMVYTILLHTSIFITLFIPDISLMKDLIFRLHVLQIHHLCGLRCSQDLTHVRVRKLTNGERCYIH